MQPKVAQVVEQLESLPPSRLEEVIDFIEFLNARQADRGLTRAYTAASEPALKRVWDNPEDDIYNDL